MIKQILRLLENGRVSVTLCHLRGRGGLWGLCDREDKELFVHKRLCTRNRVRALIHESVHFLYPNFSEVTVLNIEDDIVRHLSVSEYTRLSTFVETT